METTTPNTPSELIKINQQPLEPEQIWEEFMKLDCSDQEKFLWNGVRVMRDFHQFVVQRNSEEETPVGECGQWVIDGVKWELMLQLLDSMDSDSN